MKESFLHYLWKFKRIKTDNLTTTEGQSVTIVNFGQFLELSGPDFFNAQIIIDNQRWAGNIEIHVKSSDWYLHQHEINPAYDNVILHVVWEHDTDVYNKSNTLIPVLELKHFVSQDLLDNFTSLMKQKSWIYCQNQISNIDGFVFNNWKQRLVFERLEQKLNPINELLAISNNDWEAVLFCVIAKNFGLNTNGVAFLEIAKAIPFSVIRKESDSLENIESLLLGNAGFLDEEKEDTFFKDLKFRFYYLLNKYKLEKVIYVKPEFYKHRPDNFPNIRLSQLANLYCSNANLFEKIISATSIKEIYKLFNVSASLYWQTHYQFDKESKFKQKKLSDSFIDLLIINAIIPLKFAFARYQGVENSDFLIEMLLQISSESNTIIDKFADLNVQSENALDSQALLHLKKEYCNQNKCLSCSVGLELLKN